MRYIAEFGPHWSPTPFDLFPVRWEGDYRYKLELNANGEIIGGEWSDADRPTSFGLKPPRPMSRRTI